MAADMPVERIDAFGHLRGRTDCVKIINLEMDVLDERLRFRIDVAHGRVKLSDIVPLARTISGRIADIVIDKHHKDGIEIACRKGCGHCCRSHLVPLAVPEAFRLNEYIHSRHRDLRDAMLRSCLLAAQDILDREPPESFTPPTLEPVDSRGFLADVSTWYVSLGVCCPFLSNHVCTIYENRPLACRDYFVRGGSNACINADPTTGPLKMPVPMVEVLGQLAGELEGSDIEAVILPLTPAWCEQNAHRAERTWPAETVAELFVELVSTRASENSMQLALSG